MKAGAVAPNLASLLLLIEDRKMLKRRVKVLKEVEIPTKNVLFQLLRFRLWRLIYLWRMMARYRPVF